MSQLACPKIIPDNYAYSTLIVTIYEAYKRLLDYKKPITIKEFLFAEKMKNNQEQIEESIKVVSVHFKVSKLDKHISIPHNTILEKKPKRTQTHLRRLTKKGFHIQTAIK